MKRMRNKAWAKIVCYLIDHPELRIGQACFNLFGEKFYDLTDEEIVNIVKEVRAKES